MAQNNDSLMEGLRDEMADIVVQHEWGNAGTLADQLINLILGVE